jgi:hypothetical protein
MAMSSALTTPHQKFTNVKIINTDAKILKDFSMLKQELYFNALK